MEKRSQDDVEEATVNVVSEGDEEDGGEYPSGVKMTFIVVALVLSIFLVSHPFPVAQPLQSLQTQMIERC